MDFDEPFGGECWVVGYMGLGGCLIKLWVGKARLLDWIGWVKYLMKLWVTVRLGPQLDPLQRHLCQGWVVELG